ncbi:MAG: glycogen/starch synthase, partial [Candidatus Omnitrophica bacterium]|nr:glycogen/starch synthase [Candidatus Omnitrophota bacterium]
STNGKVSVLDHKIVDLYIKQAQLEGRGYLLQGFISDWGYPEHNDPNVDKLNRALILTAGLKITLPYVGTVDVYKALRSANIVLINPNGRAPPQDMHFGATRSILYILCPIQKIAVSSLSRKLIHEICEGTAKQRIIAEGGTWTEQIAREMHAYLENSLNKSIKLNRSNWPSVQTRHIAFVTPEFYLTAKIGGAADATHGLAMEFARKGHRVSVFTNKYASLPIKNLNFRYMGSIWVNLGDWTAEVYVMKAQHQGIDIYTLEHGYLTRKPYIDEIGLLQSIMLSRGSLEAMKAFGIKPDIINAHDWQAALTVGYLRAHPDYNSYFYGTKGIFTVHNSGVGYQGEYSSSEFYRLGLPQEELPGFEFNNRLNLIKSGVVHADKVNTVSLNYASELLTPLGGGGLHNIFLSRGLDFVGIVNGIDYETWNPRTDKTLSAPYSNYDVDDKKPLNKAALQKELGLEVNPDAILISMIARMDRQKGVELLGPMVRRLLTENPRVQVIIAGKEADKQAVDQIRHLWSEFPGRAYVWPKFIDEDVAHRIYASSDIFLVPSKFEPCGLTQMIACRYGTIPVVRRVGGLPDTIMDYEPETREGQGFVFDGYNSEELLQAIQRAIVVYADKERWSGLIQQAMHKDFTWDYSAANYTLLYEDALTFKNEEEIVTSLRGKHSPADIQDYRNRVQRAREEGKFFPITNEQVTQQARGDLRGIVLELPENQGSLPILDVLAGKQIFWIAEKIRGPPDAFAEGDSIYVFLHKSELISEVICGIFIHELVEQSLAGKGIDVMRAHDLANAVCRDFSRDEEFSRKETIQELIEPCKADIMRVMKLTNDKERARQMGEIVDMVDGLKVDGKPMTADDLEVGEVELLDTFEETVDAVLYGRLKTQAEDMYLEGRFVPHFNFGGAATRLGLGGMYFVQVKEVAKYLLGMDSNLSGEQKERVQVKLNDHFQEAKVKEAKDRRLTEEEAEAFLKELKDNFYAEIRANYSKLDSSEDSGMGPRQIQAYYRALTRLAQERGRDVEQVLDKAIIIVHFNDKILESASKDMFDHGFYGFRGENVYILTDRVFRGYALDLRTGTLFLQQDSQLLPPGHGYALEQFNRKGQVYQLDENGKLFKLEDTILDILDNRQVEMMRTQRINDLTMWTHDVLSIERLAFFIYAAQRGKKIGIELVGNPEGQKGGSYLRLKGTRRAFLAEKLALLAKHLKSLLDKAGREKLPYNAFRNYYTVKGLKSILKRTYLPRYLKYEGGCFYTDMVTGDVTQLCGDSVVAFRINRDENIHDLKAQSNLLEGLRFALIYERGKPQAEQPAASDDQALSDNLAWHEKALPGSVTLDIQRKNEVIESVERGLIADGLIPQDESKKKVLIEIVRKALSAHLDAHSAYRGVEDAPATVFGLKRLEIQCLNIYRLLLLAAENHLKNVQDRNAVVALVHTPYLDILPELAEEHIEGGVLDNNEIIVVIPAAAGDAKIAQIRNSLSSLMTGSALESVESWELNIGLPDNFAASAKSVDFIVVAFEVEQRAPAGARKRMSEEDLAIFAKKLSLAQAGLVFSARELESRVPVVISSVKAASLPLLFISEDENLVRALLDQYLKRFFGKGKAVIQQFVNNDDTLAALERGARPDIVFLDFAIPGILTQELYKRIRELSPATKVIVMSAFSVKDKDFRGRFPGVDAFMQKPFDESTVQMKLNMLGFPGGQASSMRGRHSAEDIRNYRDRIVKAGSEGRFFNVTHDNVTKQAKALLEGMEIRLSKDVSIVLGEESFARKEVVWISEETRGPPDAFAQGNLIYVFLHKADLIPLTLAEAILHEVIEQFLLERQESNIDEAHAITVRAVNENFIIDNRILRRNIISVLTKPHMGELIAALKIADKEERVGKIETIVDATSALKIDGNPMAADDLEVGEVELLDTFEDTVDPVKYGELKREAEDMYLDGRFAPHFNFGGAATRLGLGEMYTVQIKEAVRHLLAMDSNLPGDQRARVEARMDDFFNDVQKAEIKKRKLTPDEAEAFVRKFKNDFYEVIMEAYTTLDSSEDSGMGPRQIQAYYRALTRLAQEKDRDVEQVLKNAAIVIHLNQEVLGRACEDLLAHRFYGFKRENVYILIDNVFRGWVFDLRTGALIENEDSKRLPPGHGYALEQFNKQGQVHQLDEYGELKQLEGNLLDILDSRGVEFIRTQRINDLTMWTHNVLSIERLAYFIYQAKERGKKIGIELVGNPEGQKGGSYLRLKDTRRAFLAEKLALLAPQLKALLDKAGREKLPYNAFRNYYTVKGLQSIVKRTHLPAYLKFEKERESFYIEMVTGDVTQLCGDDVVAFRIHFDENIHDFKEPKNLPEGLDFIRQYEQGKAHRAGFASHRGQLTSEQEAELADIIESAKQEGRAYVLRGSSDRSYNIHQSRYHTRIQLASSVIPHAPVRAPDGLGLVEKADLHEILAAANIVLINPGTRAPPTDACVHIASNTVYLIMSINEFMGLPALSLAKKLTHEVSELWLLSCLQRQNVAITPEILKNSHEFSCGLENSLITQNILEYGEEVGDAVILGNLYRDSGNACCNEISAQEPSCDVIVITAGDRDMAETYDKMYNKDQRRKGKEDSCIIRSGVPVVTQQTFDPYPKLGNGGALAHALYKLGEELDQLRPICPHIGDRKLEELRIVVIQAGGFGTRLALTFKHCSKPLMLLPKTLVADLNFNILDEVIKGAYKFTQALKAQGKPGLVLLNGDGLLVTEADLHDGIGIITYPELKKKAHKQLGVVVWEEGTHRIVGFREKPDLSVDPDYLKGMVDANTASFVATGPQYPQFLGSLLHIAREFILMPDESTQKPDVDTSNEFFVPLTLIDKADTDLSMDDRATITTIEEKLPLDVQ